MMSDLIERLPEMLRKVAKTESDEGEYGITEHIDWMAADEIERQADRIAELEAELAADAKARNFHAETAALNGEQEVSDE